jgi:hypothetical protein
MPCHFYHGSTSPGKDVPEGRRNEGPAFFAHMSVDRPDGGYGPSGDMVGDTTLSAAMRFRDTFRSR